MWEKIEASRVIKKESELAFCFHHCFYSVQHLSNTSCYDSPPSAQGWLNSPGLYKTHTSESTSIRNDLFNKILLLEEKGSSSVVIQVYTSLQSQTKSRKIRYW